MTKRTHMKDLLDRFDPEKHRRTPMLDDAPVGTETGANPLPDYFHLLLVASRASEAVDRFDLRSSDPDSVIAFRKLREESLQATIVLLDYITAHKEAIKRWLSEECQL